MDSLAQTDSLGYFTPEIVILFMICSSLLFICCFFVPTRFSQGLPENCPNNAWIRQTNTPPNGRRQARKRSKHVFPIKTSKIIVLARKSGFARKVARKEVGLPEKKWVCHNQRGFAPKKWVCPNCYLKRSGVCPQSSGFARKVSRKKWGCPKKDGIIWKMYLPEK